MKLVTLGTSAMIPTNERNHLANFLMYKDEGILVDCGEGTQRQFRHAKIRPTKITRLLITHWHGDHILGMPGLFQTLKALNYNKTLHIYGPKGTKENVKKLFSFFVPSERMIKHEVHEIREGKVFETDNFYVETKKLNHKPATYGYRFVEKDILKIRKDMLEKYKVKGRIIKDLQAGKDIEWDGKKIPNKKMTYVKEGKVVAFIFDTGKCDNLIKLAKDANVALIESTLTEKEKDKAEECNHLTAADAAKIAKKAKVKKLVLTHFSQRYKSNSVFLEEAKKHFKNVIAAKDLLELEL